MSHRPLDLTRGQILAYRLAVGALDERRPAGAEALREAAWAGLQDSMPRAALLSIHARVQGTEPRTREHPSLVQLWGPRFSAFVVAARDRGVFTLGRLPEDAGRRRFAEDMAGRLDSLLAGRSMAYGAAGRALGVPPNALRYAAPTGRILMHWDGARQPTIWTVPAPEVDAAEARRELARRYLHVFGPTTAAAFAEWGGIAPTQARAAFEALAPELTPVRTPVGDAWLLARDEPAIRTPATSVGLARLLPSGDPYLLLWGPDRELVVPDADRRRRLWTPRVWPGGILLGGEVVGTWRRSHAAVTLQPWRRLTDAEREALIREAEAMPLPGNAGRILVTWQEEPR